MGRTGTTSSGRSSASHAGKDELPRVKNGMGVAIVSTPQGVMSGYEARRRGVGGEVLCTVW